MAGELGLPLKNIVISGGGAKSGLFMQIFADVFGLPAARCVDDGGGAALGAAMCAAAATGAYADTAAASAAMGAARESFAPHLGNTAIYQRISDTVFHDIRLATDPLLERAYPLFC
jgi:sugar (pentulose or hexulose) kinase